MIKAVLFDLDGVLIDSFDANYKFYSDLLSKAGYTPPTKDNYFPMFHLTMKQVIKVITQSTSEEEIQRIWKMGNSREIPYPNDMLKLQDGVEETLLALYKIYPLGIVTSRVRNGVFEFQELAALQKYFKTVVAYEDTQKHKPDPEPLLLGAKNLHAEPRNVVYIGDLENDLQAARAAGLKIIMYSEHAFTDADAVTTSFRQIPSLLKKLHG